MTDTPLKPCPFCGGEAKIIPSPTSSNICCGNVVCLVSPLIIGGSYPKAEAAWNTRHVPEITDEDVERVGEELYERVYRYRNSDHYSWKKAPEHLQAQCRSIARAALTAFLEDQP